MACVSGADCRQVKKRYLHGLDDYLQSEVTTIGGRSSSECVIIAGDGKAVAAIPDVKGLAPVPERTPMGPHEFVAICN